MPCPMPSRDQVGPETPFRLAMAAALAFPDGSMSASGLCREAARYAPGPTVVRSATGDTLGVSAGVADG